MGSKALLPFALTVLLLGTAFNALVGQGIQTLRVSVIHGKDDAEEPLFSGIVNWTSSDLELVSDGSDQIIGIRFSGVSIPKEAMIEEAFLQFTTDEPSGAATSLVIHGEGASDSKPFASTPFQISSRIKTLAKVVWNDILPWNKAGERGSAQQSPDLKMIVQEIIQQPEWQTGNPVTFILTGKGKRVAVSRDRSADNAPQLIVRYTLEAAEEPVLTSLPAEEPSAIESPPPSIEEVFPPSIKPEATTCYDRWFQEGMAALDGEDFPAAAQKFQEARNCSDKTVFQWQEASFWLEKAQESYISQLYKALMEKENLLEQTEKKLAGTGEVVIQLSSKFEKESGDYGNEPRKLSDPHLEKLYKEEYGKVMPASEEEEPVFPEMPFKRNSKLVDHNYFGILAGIAVYLKEHPSQRLIITGISVGENDPEELAYQRAKSVIRNLVNYHHIPRERVVLQWEVDDIEEPGRSGRVVFRLAQPYDAEKERPAGTDR